MRRDHRTSKAGDDFGTPENVCKLLYDFWDGPPALDPCTGPTAILRAHAKWSVGGLQRDWFGDGRWEVFVNPPYSRLLPWMRKCWEEISVSRLHPEWPKCELIALPPASTSSGWWEKYASQADAVAFTKRLSFIGGPDGGLSQGSARFSSALIYYGPRTERFKEVMAPITTWFAKTA
jgi:hypothetical protein